MIAKLEGHTAGLTGLSLNENETLLVTGSIDKFAYKILNNSNLFIYILLFLYKILNKNNEKKF